MSDLELPPVARWTRRLLGLTGVLVLSASFAVGLAVLPLLLLGMVDVEATVQGWLRPDPSALGLHLSWDEPRSGQLTVTNVAASPARGLRVRVVEDYGYADGGQDEVDLWLGDLAAGQRRTLSYATGSSARGVDVGAVKLWLTCDRGTAFDFCAWSYAY